MSRSVDWIRRQAGDPYVRERVKRGLNSRSAFKLEELDSKLKFIGVNKRTIDLGATPGGWSQILLERGVKNVIAVDLKEPPDNIKLKLHFILGDFLEERIQTECLQKLGGHQAVRDLILSDMAPNSTGDGMNDHFLNIELCRSALKFSDQVLNKKSGTFLCKVFQGVEEEEFSKEMKLRFKEFKRIKPPACRKESRELYYFGRNKED